MATLILLLILAAQHNITDTYRISIVFIACLGFVIRIVEMVLKIIKDYHHHVHLYEKAWKWQYERKNK